jgi:hypothetical protein
MSGTLYREVADVTYTPEGGSAIAINQISGISLSRGGTRIASSADDMKRQSLVDSTDHTSTIIIYLKNFPKAVGSVGAGAKAPVRGTRGVLAFTILSADGGADRPMQLGDAANTWARFMGGGANPKHADIEAAATMTFRGFCPAGDQCPLADAGA